MWENIIKHVANKNTIEFGGPSELFSHPNNQCLLYQYLNEIDGGNMDNRWQGSVNKVFSPLPNKQGIGYALDIADEAGVKSIDKKYDLIVSSHVIEHIANPIKALTMWKEVLNTDGLILSILPNKTEFWDWTRKTTTIEHLLEDFNNNTLESDMTHIDDDMNQRDWTRGGFDGRVVKSREHHGELCLDNINTRIIHHHCFDIELVQAMHEAAGYETIECFVHPTNTLQLVYLGKKK